MDESSVTSANLDQTDQDLLAHEVPDEIVEAAAEGLNICRLTFGGWPSTTVAATFLYEGISIGRHPHSSW